MAYQINQTVKNEPARETCYRLQYKRDAAFLVRIAIDMAKVWFADTATVLEDMDLAATVAVSTCIDSDKKQVSLQMPKELLHLKNHPTSSRDAFILFLQRFRRGPSDDISSKDREERKDGRGQSRQARMVKSAERSMQTMP
jgi:hypothetical protein